MTTLAFNSVLAYRVRADYGLIRRILCENMHWHDWTKWAPVTTVVKPVKGSPVLQGRECIRCGLGETKKL